MKIALIITMLTAAMLTGCATPPERYTARAAAHSAYLGQQRTYNAVSLQGTNMAITITGASSLTLDAPLDALAPMPRDPTAGEQIGAALTDIAPWAALGIIGHANRPRAPTVVEPQPAQIVRPEVVGSGQ